MVRAQAIITNTQTIVYVSKLVHCLPASTANPGVFIIFQTIVVV